MAQALLLTLALQPKSHTGTIYLFNLHFTKKGVIEPEYSQILARAQKFREEADYRHNMVFTDQLVRETLNEVQKFLDRARRFLKEKDCLA